MFGIFRAFRTRAFRSLRSGTQCYSSPAITEAASLPAKVPHQLSEQQTVREQQLEEAKYLNELRIEEYRALRAELDDVVKALRQLEIYTIGSIAAVYAWLATHIDVLQPGTLPWWIPLGIAGFGLFKNRALLIQLRALNRYMQDELEPSILVVGHRPLNWYAYLRYHYPKIFNWYDITLWGILIGITIATPIFVGIFLHPSQHATPTLPI
jgi:hypothetical protein